MLFCKIILIIRLFSDILESVITVFQITIFRANVQCSFTSLKVKPWNPDDFENADFLANSVTKRENTDEPNI